MRRLLLIIPLLSLGVLFLSSCYKNNNFSFSSIEISSSLISRQNSINYENYNNDYQLEHLDVFIPNYLTFQGIFDYRND
jgi:hypothetical protein